MRKRADGLQGGGVGGRLKLWTWKLCLVPPPLACMKPALLHPWRHSVCVCFQLSWLQPPSHPSLALGLGRAARRRELHRRRSTPRACPRRDRTSWPPHVPTPRARPSILDCSGRRFEVQKAGWRAWMRDGLGVVPRSALMVVCLCVGFAEQTTPVLVVSHGSTLRALYSYFSGRLPVFSDCLPDPLLLLAPAHCVSLHRPVALL